MKKLYTTPEYKAYQKRRLLKIEKKLRKERLAELRAKSKGKPKAKKKHKHQANDIKLPVIAPSDLRLIENTKKCLEFFRDLRSEDFRSKRGKIEFVILSLKAVTQIDYGTISILTAIVDDLKFKNIIVKSFLPDNIPCKEYMVESGYLNNLFDDNGKPFPKAPKSELMFFEKGCGRLSDEESRKISLLIKKIVGHLTGVEKYCQPLRTIILEICGNSIEWSGTDSKQWLLGVKYRDDRVIFTVTDVGKGILESLYRRLTSRFFEAFNAHTD
jgi:signal transduction histidine kinase